MKLLYLTDFSGIGGGEKSLLYLCEYAQQKKNNVLFANLYTGKLNEEATLLGIYNISLHNRTVISRGWYKGIPFFYTNTILLLLKLIRLYKPEVIHIYSSGRMLTSILAINRLIHSRVYWTCHGSWERPYGLRKYFLSKFLKKVFFVSNYVKKSSTFGKNQEIISYLGVPTANLLNLNRNKSKIRTTIAVIGRFQAVKNQMLIIELLQKHSFKNIDFLFIGGSEFGSKKDENYRKKIVNIVNRYQFKNIKIHPYANNVFKKYSEIDYILVPSLFETFSLVTAESLVRGIPVIATENGGPKEILDNGKYGTLFDPTSVISLKKALEKAIDTSYDQKTLIQRGEYFSIENYYKRIKECYIE